MLRYKAFLPKETDVEYLIPFEEFLARVSEPDKAELIFFTGGPDVSPSYYASPEPVGVHTYCNPHRDAYEMQLAHWAIQQNKPLLGICRGAQLLCVKAGGNLAQHIEGHQHEDHRILTNEGLEFLESSDHHQMMLPGDTDHELIAWTERRSGTYLNGYGKEIPNIEVEPEIVHFPKIRALCIQGHPEYLPTASLVNDFHRQLVLERLL